MTDHDKPLSGQESLDIIHRMIGRAKGNIRNRAFYFLLWGWIVIAGSMGHYLLLEFSSLNHPEWAWIVVLVGIVASFVQGYRDRKETGASTYAGSIYTTVWITFLVNYFIIIVFTAKINFFITPLILVMAGSATYVSGAILRYKPLKLGAVFVWVMAIVAFLVTVHYQLLATAAAVFVGYLIPGYMLQNSER